MSFVNPDSELFEMRFPSRGNAPKPALNERVTSRYANSLKTARQRLAKSVAEPDHAKKDLASSQPTAATNPCTIA